jgi:PIN domain
LFANRYTAFADACSLTGVLKRNLLLSLAEAAFFRLRWSRPVLEETEHAIARILAGRGDTNSTKQAACHRARMEAAFEEAMVDDFDNLLPACSGLPDENDAHVVAAALKAQASTIVTDNLKHFPTNVLEPLNLDVRSTDAFIADTIALDTGRAVAVIRRMRESFKKPEMSSQDLLNAMDAAGLIDAVDLLRPHVQSL